MRLAIRSSTATVENNPDDNQIRVVLEKVGLFRINNSKGMIENENKLTICRQM